MFISSRGAQVGDVVEDRRGTEWVVVGRSHDIARLEMIFFVVRRVTYDNYFPFRRVKGMTGKEFDKFQREGPT